MAKKITKADVKNLPQIQSNATAVKEEDVLSPELMRMLEDKVPEFVKEQAADGTAIMRWMHEYLILMEEVLRLDFGFSEEDMIRIEKRIKEMLPVIHKMKLEDTRLLRKADMAIGLDMIERNKQMFKAEQSGITLPTGELKKLK